MYILHIYMFFLIEQKISEHFPCSKCNYWNVNLWFYICVCVCACVCTHAPGCNVKYISYCGTWSEQFGSPYVQHRTFYEWFTRYF